MRASNSETGGGSNFEFDAGSNFELGHGGAVTKPALTWGVEGGMRLSLIPTSPFTQVFFQESCQQQYTYIRCINSLRQLGASTRLVRQLAASTRCVNSLHQPVCINPVHQLGASGIHRLHQRKGCSVDPNARLQRFHQCQVTAYTPGPGYIAYLMPSCVQIQLRSHACRNERSCVDLAFSLNRTDL